MTKKLKPTERLLVVISYSKLSKNAFAKRIGHSNGTTVYHILNGRNGISAKLAKEICDEFPEISFDWILEGKGDMLKNEVTSKDELEEEVTLLKKYIKGLDARIELLEKQIKE